MEASFAPAENLEQFYTQLKEAIDKDDESKTIFYVMIVVGCVALLAIAAILGVTLLKRYAGSFVSYTPIVVNPCQQSAYVPVAGLTCAFIPCAMTTNGQLNPGQFPSLYSCLDSLTQAFYPTTVAIPNSSNVAAVCTPYKGPTPPNWTGQASYTGANAQALCDSDAVAYNQNVVQLGVLCDPAKGPELCSPSGGNCVAAPLSVLQLPENLSASGCVYYIGCNPASNSCDTQFATSLSNVPSSWTNIYVGSCSTYNPCAYYSCPNVCMNFDPTKQAQAIPGKAPSLVTGSDAVTVQMGSSCSSTNACYNPQDCCNKVQEALKLTYTLSPSDSQCPTGAGTFACVYDPAIVTSCGQGSSCSQLVVDSSSSYYPFFKCVPYNTSQGLDNVAFTSATECSSVAAQLNEPFVGLQCDPVMGVVTCDVTQSGCTKITDNTVLGNLTEYISFNGNSPLSQALSPVCVSRTDKCGDACTFSQTGTECSSCPAPGNTCDYPAGTTGWTCTASSVAGITCVADSSGTTLADACKAAGGSTPCGCNCLAPNYICQNGKVLGTPCDTMVNVGTQSLPLTAVCGVTPMKSANVWIPPSNGQPGQCVSGVPYTSPAYPLYKPPSTNTDATSVCLTLPPSATNMDGWSVTSTTNGAVYFLNDPSVTQTQQIFPCPFSVYYACHGESPIAPPGGDAPFCSFDAFSGTTMYGGVSAASAMCLMNMVDMGLSYNQSVPVCLSVAQGDYGADVIMTGCIDPGAPGSVGGSPIPNAVSLQNYCGTCSQAGNIVNNPSAMCPLAPQGNGFTLQKGSDGGVCKTIESWSKDSAVPSAVQQYLQNVATNTMVMVPSLYAGIQQGGSTPFLTAAEITNPPFVNSNNYLVSYAQ